MLYSLIFVGAALTALFTLRRLRRRAYIGHGVLDVRAASRRLGHKAQPNMHSLQSESDANLCIAALAGMDGHASQARHDALDLSLHKHPKLTPDAARDMQTCAPWLVSQRGAQTPAFDQATMRPKQLVHGPHFAKLMSVPGGVAAAGSRGMPSAQQADSLGALARIIRTA